MPSLVLKLRSRVDCSACLAQWACWRTLGNKPNKVVETKARYPKGILDLPQAQRGLMTAKSEWREVAVQSQSLNRRILLCSIDLKRFCDRRSMLTAVISEI